MEGTEDRMHEQMWADMRGKSGVKNDFKVFGWYRIVLGLIVIGYFTLIK